MRGLSGFADIGPTATLFASSVVLPDTEIDDGHPDNEHPGLHESSESECGANCEYIAILEAQIASQTSPLAPALGALSIDCSVETGKSEI